MSGTRLGSSPPVRVDAWIFTGSTLATFVMARGWVDLWLVWFGVALVGVPLLSRAHVYPSVLLYVVYGCFVIWGLAVWLKVSRTESVPVSTPVTTEAGR